MYHFNKDEGDETLPLQAFRKDAASAIFLEHSKEFEIPHQVIVVVTQNITRCNLNTGVLRTLQGSKMECFCINS